MSDMKAYSLTHVISVITAGAVSIVWSILFFTYVRPATSIDIFFATFVPLGMAGAISYYAYNLKMTAKGLTENTSPK